MVTDHERVFTLYKFQDVQNLVAIQGQMNKSKGYIEQ